MTGINPYKQCSDTLIGTPPSQGIGLACGVGLIGVPTVDPSIFGFDWWSDVSNFDSLTLSGSDVVQMDDLTGNGNHFVNSAGLRPEYKTNQQNGLPAIEFNGTTEYLKCVKNFAATTEDTWFFIFQSSQDGDPNAMLFADYGDPGGKSMVFAVNNNNAARIFDVRDENGDILNAPGTLNNNYSTLTATRRPGNITLNFNGAFQSVSGTYAATSHEASNYPYLGAQGPFIPVGGVPLATTYLKGHFCEGGRIPRVLNSNELALLQRYAVEKWAALG